MPNWLPSRDYHPDLTEVRLVSFASLLREVWLRVSELHEPDQGDDTWSMSCRAFKRCGFKLKQRSQKDWHWLTVSEGRPMQYVLSIGVIPARFYHGDSSEGMPPRYTSSPKNEQIARQMLLSFDNGVRGLLRFATKTDRKGVPLSVTLVEYDADTDEIINRFDIPEQVAPAETVPFKQPEAAPGVQQEKPQPRPRVARVNTQGA